MINWNNFARGAAVSAIAISVAGVASAQITSSNLNGQVTDENGAPVAGATVTVTHTPTGTTSTETTSSNGVFFESGLRVGGPYTITAETADGTATQKNIYLQPSSNSLTIQLEPQDARTLETVVVMGSTGSRLDLNGGVGSAFTSSDILNQPATERDLIATLVRDPLAFSTGEGIMSVAGMNPRFNALAIDGSIQGDDFGLSSSTYATKRAPISLDAVESASVVASDYSVKSSGFTGGLVNVITKSGTNEFDGSLFYFKQDEDYLGNSAFDQYIEQPAFNEKEYGGTLGGPIIKDKLWFFGSYDKFESGSSANFTQGDIDGNTDPRLYAGLNDIVQTVYGFDMGGRPTVVSQPETSERFLGKIDWQINENHRASFTYQSTEETGVSNVSRTSFQSAYYATPTKLEAYTGQLYSDWTANLSTELRINYKEYSRSQDCNAGSNIGEFSIRLSEADLVGTAFEGYLDDGDANTAETRDTTFTGGCDVYRQGNTFDDQRLQLFGAANYTMGDHFITVGGEYQDYKLDNLFAQRSVGQFVFNDIADLQNQTASVSILLPDTGIAEDTRAAWGYNTLALFAQDSWQVRHDFRLDYGFRYETIMQDDKPRARSFFQTAYGDSNTENLDGNSLFMPRVSFEYTPFERTKLTGGFGLFAGGDPQVWTSAAFTPPIFFESGTFTGVNPSSGTPTALITAVQQNNANDPGPIDIISPNFKTPSDWKASLRLDQRFDLNFDNFGVTLGDDYLVSFQALYAMTNQGFRWENLAQTRLAATQPLGVAPDGRPIYADLDDLGINNAIQLTNYDQGESLTLTAALSKDYDNGLGFYASYAHQDIEAVTPGSSSRGVSNFRSIIDSDRNNPSAYTSEYQVENAFKLSLSYEKEIFGNLTSRFNLFGQVYSGEPFSYTFDVDRNNALFGRAGDGESPYDNDLLYVPAISGNAISDPNVVLASGFDEAGFIEYGKGHDFAWGKIQDRNADESTWNQRWDFQWEQELPFFNERAAKYVGDNSLKFIVNIKNVANLLNDEWGTQYNGPSYDTLNIVSADIVSAADVAAFGVDGAAALTGDAPRTTCLAAGDCVYRFNDFDADPSSSRSLTQSTYEIRIGLRYQF
ncbi:TonB-dependent receptor [Hyphomonas adhaerens]|uniref:TonB-dependent receptor n=1 Tax=Hyphomonas adhaerens TaxID=81029 RepID=UPI0023573E0C|nr:TonB-dependent receptor [Hyphomonas adhaerens]|tara:strand:- start:4457 stop:7765 length:3309 start_codon:yes stop_codon:yes gene_type:complete